jgi:hypothetical protein
MLGQSLALSRKATVESSYVDLRAMLERWADFRLLRDDTTGDTFNYMYIAGALVLLRKNPDPAVENMLQARFGQAFSTAREKSSNRPFAHWSDSSRKIVVGAKLARFITVLRINLLG